MSMFDYYKPNEQLSCPNCETKLDEWQGKEGPCALLVWEQGSRFPIDQKAGEECNLSINERNKFQLPEQFEIYSYDCPNHHPVLAICKCRSGVWETTEVKE